MKTFHVFNPGAKWIKCAEQAVYDLRLKDTVVRIAKKHPHHTDTAVEWALNEGCDSVVVWGGDGTINRVVRALCQRKAINKVTIGIVPVGTCNDTARFLGLKSGDVSKAFNVISENNERAWNIGIVNGVPFINNAGFGRRFDASQSYGKKNAISSIWRMRPLNLEAEWAEGKVAGRYLMGLICNAPYFSGGLHFSKNVSPFDRDLDVFLVKAIPNPKLIFRLGLGRLGIQLQDNNVTNFRTSTLNIRFSEEIWPQADGEPPEPPTRMITFGMLNESLRMIVPK